MNSAHDVSLMRPLTGMSMELDRIRLKEAIVMWPDMHSFLELDKFEPISNS